MVWTFLEVLGHRFERHRANIKCNHIRIKNEKLEVISFDGLVEETNLEERRFEA